MAIKVKFQNWLAVDRKIETNPGNAFKPVYSPVVKEDGRIELVQKGQTDLQEYIQSFKDSVDINRIIQRYSNGDLSALNARAATFMDATAFPETYAEMLNTVINAENFFSELPADVKKNFDNNYYKFIASIGSPEFRAMFGLEEKASESSAPVVPESKGDDVSE